MAEQSNQSLLLTSAGSGAWLGHTGRTASLASIEASLSIICTCIPPLYPALSIIRFNAICVCANGVGERKTRMKRTDINLTHTLIHDDMYRLRTNTYNARVEFNSHDEIRNGSNSSLYNGILIMRTVDVELEKIPSPLRTPTLSSEHEESMELHDPKSCP